MNEQVIRNENEKRAVLYCRSKAGSQVELKTQNECVSTYAKANGFKVLQTVCESGEMDALTYRNFRLRAKYREFDILLVSELATFGNSPIEITHEVNYLANNGVKVLSVQDGELNIMCLPILFRKSFRCFVYNPY